MATRSKRGKKTQNSTAASASAPSQAQAAPTAGAVGADAAPSTIHKGIYLQALIYLEGDQAPADDFNAFAKAALAQALKSAPQGVSITLKNAEEKTDIEDNSSDNSNSKHDGKFQF